MNKFINFPFPSFSFLLLPSPSFLIASLFLLSLPQSLPPPSQSFKVKIRVLHLKSTINSQGSFGGPSLSKPSAQRFDGFSYPHNHNQAEISILRNELADQRKEVGRLQASLKRYNELGLPSYSLPKVQDTERLTQRATTHTILTKVLEVVHKTQPDAMQALAELHLKKWILQDIHSKGGIWNGGAEFKRNRHRGD